MKTVNSYSPEFFNGQKVLVRVDYNVPLKEEAGKVIIEDDSRMRLSLPTLKFLSEAGAKIILLSHLGQPEGKFAAELSLLPVAQKLNELAFGLIGYRQKVLFSPEIIGGQVEKMAKDLNKGQMMLLENLRFNPGEEANDPLFTKRLAKIGNFYINDAFSACHREHASVVGLPKFLPKAAGLALFAEVNRLEKVLTSPDRPLVMVVGGIKEDKLKFASQVVDWADRLLVGGLLPKLIAGFPQLKANPKVVLGKLTADEQDLNDQSQAEFSRIICQAKTVIFAGPVGNTSQGHFQATEKLFRAAIASGALLLAGGGDTQSALTSLNLADSMDYIASGGGAMLDFLAKRTLPGIEALEK